MKMEAISPRETSGVRCVSMKDTAGPGENRVSMSLTLAGSDGEYFLSAITSGGSQGMFFKMNTMGEEAFLETIAEVVDSL